MNVIYHSYTVLQHYYKLIHSNQIQTIQNRLFDISNSSGKRKQQVIHVTNTHKCYIILTSTVPSLSRMARRSARHEVSRVRLHSPSDVRCRRYDRATTGCAGTSLGSSLKATRRDFLTLYYTKHNGIQSHFQMHSY